MFNKWWEKAKPIGVIHCKTLDNSTGGWNSEKTHAYEFVEITETVSGTKLYITNQTYKERGAEHAEPLVIMEDFVVRVEEFE